MIRKLLLVIFISFIRLHETTECGDIFGDALLRMDPHSVLLVMQGHLQHTLEGFLIRLLGEGLIESTLELKQANEVVLTCSGQMYRMFKNFNLRFEIDPPRVSTSHDPSESPENCKITIEDNKLLKLLMMWGIVETNGMSLMDKGENLNLVIIIDIEKKHEDGDPVRGYVVKISLKGEETTINETTNLPETNVVLDSVLLLVAATKEDLPPPSP
eukprot:GAHX01000929.1.p1 GENE.GAHX01000929.1~~GAHX01000929.1.p1  ORF type:complete len:214 (-),score=32.85 GAHX01000929.1:101-742(-)